MGRRGNAKTPFTDSESSHCHGGGIGPASVEAPNRILQFLGIWWVKSPFVREFVQFGQQFIRSTRQFIRSARQFVRSAR